jgi:hypothetical protein
MLRRVAAGVSLVSLLLFTSPSVFAGCGQRCYESPDIIECRATQRIGGGDDCRITSSCTVYAYDPDGPGPNPPVIGAECTYACEIQWCSWV